MSNFIYYEKLEDYEEQVKKAKLCDEKDKEIERLNNIINKAIEFIQARKSTQEFRKNELKEKETNIDIMLEHYRDILEILEGENND